MVPQDPMSNLNPVWKIGYQVREAELIRIFVRKRLRKNVIRVLEEAGLPDAQRRSKQYVPHEFSGGMRQRINRHRFGC